MTKRGERKGGLQVDLDVERQLEQAVPNRAAQTWRQRYDADRVRVRVDVPEWVKGRLGELADHYGTSATQLGAFALAWWVLEHERGNEDLREVLADSLEVSRALRISRDVSLEEIVERLKALESGAQ
ncbi:MAG TPA: hypothetical protein VMY40_10040 [Anaerolineae bacterium]|uniref:Uncharacterized protein n=1 Tax=viral metagenome TaxID=1070528 RepID=A0A6M3M8C9_9ZZZZ|nr:hypothetical protein [Anaerolineae bacterium]